MTPPIVISGTPPVLIRNESTEEAQKYLDLFKSFHIDHIDCARAYGLAEKNFGAAKYFEQGFTLDTKIKSMPGDLVPEKVHASFNESLSLLGVKKVNILYLHGPDRTTPFEATLRAINEIYQSGGFEKFGLSNYSANDIVEILAICDKNGWIRPTVYQGNYNAVTRKNEKELFPLLRKEKITFYAYSPLAGGFLLGNIKGKDQADKPGTRFNITDQYKNWYFKDSYFSAVNEFAEEVKKYNLTPAEVAIRWIMHHSILDGSLGDAVLVGGGSTLEGWVTNFTDYRKGPLPLELANYVTDMWKKVEKDAPDYHL
eukprot:TRINITY_DN1144_c0_g3_i2.p1 TRINITY_DN1144_c0_g3~~TRINITY_DN1144_c0_g3_i2.p1  ORF type:complete len:313 (-),score=68.28 TRINITY_DN1144_c0_g3_i2:794-1732(-)